MSMADLFQNERGLYTERPSVNLKTGIVKETDDPRRPGQVKVEIFLKENDAGLVEWAKVLSPYAGKNHGLCFLPEIGDEVLLIFDSGDIHQPIVVGSLFAPESAQTDSEPVNSQTDIKQIKTKGGHQITFHDTKGQESVEIKTPDENMLLLDDLNHSILLKDKSGLNSIEIDIKAGAVTIKGALSLSLETNNQDQLITLDALSNKASITSETIELEARRVLKIKAPNLIIQSGALDINATADLKLQSSGVTSIKGAVIKLN